MSTYERRTRFLMLDCLHKVEIAEPVPALKAEQYCIRCGTYRIVDMYLTNYKTKCKAGKQCSFGRNFGDDEAKAFAVATKHTASNPRHTVAIFRNADKIGEVTNSGTDLFSTHSEMREQSRAAQSILRGAFPGTEALAEGDIPF